MATEKITFIVLDENTFCYVDPRRPMRGCILMSKPQKGALHSWRDGFLRFPEDLKGVRSATRHDFEDYRIGFDQYARFPDRYEMPVI